MARAVKEETHQAGQVVWVLFQGVTAFVDKSVDGAGAGFWVAKRESSYPAVGEAVSQEAPPLVHSKRGEVGVKPREVVEEERVELSVDVQV